MKLLSNSLKLKLLKNSKTILNSQIQSYVTEISEKTLFIIKITFLSAKTGDTCSCKWDVR